MNAATDSRIDAFRQTVDRAELLRAQLDTLNISLARRDELPGLIAGCGCGPQAAWLREEMAATGHPLSIRIRHVQVERELREVLAGSVVTMRAALDAATQLVTVAAGGVNAVMTFPFARRHLQELARYRTPPSLPDDRLALLRSAWLAIDAAVASLGEIRFDARQRTSTS